MSLFDTTTGGLASFGLAGAAAAFNYLHGGYTLRSIGGIVAPCTLQERHSDHLEITRHPVETGAAITDHAFMQPVSLDITVGWGAGGWITGGYNLRQIYWQLLHLQKSARPFEIVTGKRTYKNMLIEEIGTTTGLDTENSLIVYLSCREVIIVETQVTSMAKAENQANPQNTSGVESAGTVQTSESPWVPGGAVFPKLYAVK